MIKDLIKNNDKLYFIARVLKNGKDKDFRRWVTDITDSPSIVRVENFGDKNPDKLFYLIDIDDDGAHSGFFSLLNGTVKRLELADRLGAIPYIRWINTPYSNEINNSNTYSIFFDEISDDGYEEILQSRNVIISRPQDGFERDESRVYAEKSGYLEQMGDLYRKYIRLKPELAHRIDSDQSKLGNGYLNHTIGIHVRGTDYRQSLKGHPKAIMYEEYAEAVDEMLKEYPDHNIFLATDDKGAIDYFSDRFGEKICYYEDVFRGDSDLGIHYMNGKRDDHAFRLGYEVLRDTDTLSRCDVLVAGVSFVSFTAREMKASRQELYSKVNIINHGINKNGTTSAGFNKKFNKR